MMRSPSRPGAIIAWFLALSIAGPPTAARGEERTFCVPERCPPSDDCCTDDVLEIRFVDEEGRLAGPGLVAAPGERVRVVVTIDVASDGIQLWSWAVKHDPAVLAIESVTTEGTDFAALGPRAFDVTTIAYRGELPNQGFAQGLAIDGAPRVTLPVGDDVTVAFATYTVDGAFGQTTAIEFADEELSTFAGGPVVSLNLTVAGSGRLPSHLVDAELSIQPRYRRGDAGGDGRAGLADAVVILRGLFGIAPSPPIDCDAAHDVTGNGRVAIDDAVSLLNWLFRRGERPPEPFLACDFPGDLPCAESNCAGVDGGGR